MSFYLSLTKEQRAIMLGEDELKGPPQIPGGGATAIPSLMGAPSVGGVGGGHATSSDRKEGGEAGGVITTSSRNAGYEKKSNDNFANFKAPKVKGGPNFKSKNGKQQQYPNGAPPNSEGGKSKSHKYKGGQGYNPQWDDGYARNPNYNNIPSYSKYPAPVRKSSPGVSNNGGLKFNASLSAAPSHLPHASSSPISNGTGNSKIGFSSSEERMKSFLAKHCENVMTQPPTFLMGNIGSLVNSFVANNGSKLSGLGGTPKSAAAAEPSRRADGPADGDIVDSDNDTTIKLKEEEDENEKENLKSDSGISESLESLSFGRIESESPSTTNAFKYQDDLEAIFATNPPLLYEPIAPFKMTHSVDPNLTLSSSAALDVKNGNATAVGVHDSIVTTIPSLVQTPSLVTTMAASSENNSSKASGGGGTQTLKELLEQHRQQREAAKSLQALQENKKSKPKPQKGLFNKFKVPRAILEQTRLLPIFTRKEELLELVRQNQFIIVIGETGSGKSTQIPQYLAEAGLHGTKKIGVTQPRRVAAKSLADRVAQECGVKVGTAVGYAVRFDKKVSGSTVIKYMTDGLLVKECATEANLDTYSIIIIDEAHERSIHTDVCFGLLKRAARKRPDLKVIISSATLEEKKFAEYFNAPVFNVSGKGFEVEIKYNPKSEYDYMHGAVDTIIDINRRESPGDILVFLSGQEEIEQLWDFLETKLAQIGNSLYADLIIIPCYGSLPFEEQQKIFEETPRNARKVVLATNIAETSLTIEGIVYVIDCGYYKQNEYNAKSGIYSLVKKRITKFQAIQRAGRAGRTRAGKCYRLYSEREFNYMKNASSPEITRCNVESVILDIISMGIPNPLEFEFMDPPPREAIAEAIEHLLELGGLDDNLELTDLGRRMSEFPLEPSLAKVVIESEKLGCSPDVLQIVALLSTQCQNLFSRSKRERQESDACRAKFNNTDGDLLSLLTVYSAWLRERQSEQWCQERYIQYRILAEAEEIRQQLKDILSKRGISSYNRIVGITTTLTASERIRRAFTAGYFRQLAKKKIIGHAYQVLGDSSALEDAYLHPSSSLFHHKHPWVIYHEIMKTSKTFMRGVIAVDPSWIAEYAPKFARKVAAYGVPTK